MRFRSRNVDEMRSEQPVNCDSLHADIDDGDQSSGLVDSDDPSDGCAIGECDSSHDNWMTNNDVNHCSANCSVDSDPDALAAVADDEVEQIDWCPQEQRTDA